MNDLQRVLQQLRKKGPFLRGLLGDFEGNIVVNNRPGFYYVRVEKPGGYEVGVFPGRVRLLYNLPVRIETHPLTKMQFIAGVDDESLLYAGTDPKSVPVIENHADTHAWGGSDMLNWLHTLQLYPLRCQPHPTNPDMIIVQGGVYLSEAQLSWLRSPIEVDLSAHRNLTSTHFVLLSIDSEHVISVISTEAQDVEGITSLPGGKFLIAAVCLRRNEPIAMNDIVDLRFLNSGVVNGGIEISEDYIIIGDPATGRWTKIGNLGDAFLGMEGRATGIVNYDSTDYAGIVLQRLASDSSRALILWGDNAETESTVDELWFAFHWHGDPNAEPPIDPEIRYLAKVSPNGIWTFYADNSEAELPQLLISATGPSGIMLQNPAGQHGAWWLDLAGNLHLHNYETGKDVILGASDGAITLRAGSIIMADDKLVDGVDISAHAAAYNPHSTAFTHLKDAPAGYADSGGKYVRVKSSEDGLEFDVGGWSETETLLLHVHNGSSGDLAKGKIVRITGYDGNSGLPDVELATAISEPGSVAVGMIQNDIAWNETGYVIIRGLIAVDALEYYSAGTVLWLTENGDYDSLPSPSGPYPYPVRIGIVVYEDNGVDSIYVDIEPSPALRDVAEVNLNSPTAGQLLAWNEDQDQWENDFTAFTRLKDAPANYTGSGGKYVRVKSSEDGLEFATPAGSGDMIKAVYDTDDDGIVDAAAGVAGIEVAGNSEYYGTDASGNIGFHTLPDNGNGIGEKLYLFRNFH